MKNSLNTTFLKIESQLLIVEDTKERAHAKLTRENYLDDKKSLVYDYLKFKTKTSGLINRLPRTGKAGGNTAKRTQVHSIYSYSTWELNL